MFKVILDYVVSSKLAWYVYDTLPPKQKKVKNKNNKRNLYSCLGESWGLCELRTELTICSHRDLRSYLASFPHPIPI